MDPLSPLLAFMGGLLSFLSPCVLPLVPGYLCFCAGMSFDELQKHNSRHILPGTLAFVLGFSTVFVAFGMAAALAYPLTASRSLSVIAGLFIIFLGIHIMGLLPLSVLEKHLLSKEWRFTPPPQTRLFFSYITGLAFAFGWTPCIGPILAAALALASQQEHLLHGAGLLSLYAAGLGLPFLLAALTLDKFIQISSKIKKHMPKLRYATGLLLILTGLLIATHSLETIAFRLLDLLPFLGSLG